MAESTLTPNRWTSTRKTAIVLDLLRGGDAGELARRYGLSQAQLFAWRDRFLEGGQASLVGVLDAGSRECVGVRFARRGRAVEAVDALEQGIVQRYGSLAHVPEGLRLRHDNGSIFLARHFVGTAQQLASTQEFIPRYAPEYNGVIERFFRTLKQECVWLHHFETFEEAESIIMAWIDRYNTTRQHSALG